MSLYTWAFINLTVCGTTKYFNHLFLFKTITKIGRTHEAHTGGHCTGEVIFTHTTIVDLTRYKHTDFQKF